MRVATALEADQIDVFSDSQLVVNQIHDEYEANEEGMATYLVIVKQAIRRFKAFQISHIPRAENNHADALLKLASATNPIITKMISVTHLQLPSIHLDSQQVVSEISSAETNWMTPIKFFSTERSAPRGQNRD